MNKKEKKQLRNIVIATFIGFLAIQMGFLAPYGINPFFDLAVEEEIVTGADVYAKINTRALLTLSNVDVEVTMYDVDGAFMDVITTSSGIGTFGSMIPMGTHVWLQARQAAPAAADPYISPLTEWEVPISSEGGDTVTLKNVATGGGIIWLRDVGAVAPSLTIRNGFDNHTLTGTAAQSYLNTTDSSIRVTVTVSSSDTYYGGESFTDMQTGKIYAGGVFLMWKGEKAQSWATSPTYQWSDTTNMFYIWKMANTLFYDADGDPTAKSATLVLALTGSDTFTADSAISFDAFDLVELIGGKPVEEADLINGGAIDVTAVAAKVA